MYNRLVMKRSWAFYLFNYLENHEKRHCPILINYQVEDIVYF